MDPLSAGIITGGMGLIGSMFSSNSTAQANQQNVQAQMAINQSNQQFTERMSNTAYQRSAADMKAAGLNPMAMFSSGSGGPASAPQGTQQAPRVEPTGRAFENMTHTASAAVNAAATAKQIDLTAENIANARVENSRLHALTLLAGEQMMQTRASTGLTKQQTSTEQQRTSLEEIRKILAGSEIPAATTKKLEDLGVLENVKEKTLGAVGTGKYIGRSFMDFVNPFVGGARSLKSILPRTY